MIARYDINGGGMFLAEGRTINVTDEEIEAMGRGELPKERIEVVTVRLQSAMGALFIRPAEGRC